IALLNGHVIETKVSNFTKGCRLWSNLIEEIGLKEPEYFGLEFLHPNTKYEWLNMKENVLSQIFNEKLQLSVKFMPTSFKDVKHEQTL
ncbi:MAG: Tyrosine-protein phosphatase non-receptor type 14, partial [Paramarteilia canceri]